MKRLVLNMVYGVTHKANSGKALVYPGKGLRALSHSGCVAGPSIPLFLRDVGQYYWNWRQVLSEYEMNEGKCVENGYFKMFRFFDTNTLFFIGCREGYFEVVKYLVERGVDVHTKRDWALVVASSNGHLDIVKYLVEHGADVHARDDLALIWASEDGHFEVVKYLVEHGADVNAENDCALRQASRYGHFEVAKYLVEHGAVINVL